jgi:hypothetical protein
MMSLLRSFAHDKLTKAVVDLEAMLVKMLDCRVHKTKTHPPI